MVNINPIGPESIRPTTGQTPGGKVTPNDAMESFQNILKTALKEINDKQAAGTEAVNKLATGETQNLSEVMQAVEEADISLKVLVEIRNKLVTAYDEIMRLRI